MTGTDDRDLYVITGISASGKSTVARLLADRLTPSACVEGDSVRVMVRNGREEMTAEPTPTALTQLRLRYRHITLLARSYLGAGFHTVVEDVILGDNLEPFLADLGDRPVHLVALTPSPEAVARREEARDKSAYGSRWTIDQLNAVLQKETPRLGLWLDSGDLTPEQTVDEILRRRAEALL